MPKEKEKESFIIVLLYKKTFISSTKLVMFAKHIEVITKEEGFKMAGTRTRRINLLACFKY